MTYTITFKEATINKRAQRLTPDGGLTDRVFYAAMFTDKNYAEKIAQELREQYPKAEVKVKKF